MIEKAAVIFIMKLSTALSRNIFFLISKKKYIKRTSRKQEANERVQRGTQTKRKHKRKQKANRAEKTKYNEEN